MRSLRYRPRQLSAGARVAVAVTLAVALGVALLSALSYVVFVRQQSADLKEALLREAEAYTASVESAIVHGPEDFLAASREYLRVRSEDSAAILVLGLPDGSTIPEATPVADTPQNRALLDTGQASKFYGDLLVDGEEYRVATIPVPNSKTGEVMGVFGAALPTAPLVEAARDVGKALILAGLGVALVGGFLSRWVAKSTLRPLTEAARTASAVTERHLSTRVSYDGPPDDVGLLVAALNSMLDRLETSFSEQRRFVADASHEMRTPMTIVRGHLDIMRCEGGLSKEQEETLDVAVDELERMSNVLQDLLSLARIDGRSPPPFESLDLGEVVEEAVVRGQSLGPRRFSFTHGGPLPVRGNRDLLLQALLNLVSNAVRHTGEGGLIRVSCRTQANRAAVAVIDDGPGIPEADLERVFDRFYRSNGRSRSGAGSTGLGLAIARRLVELHGGRLRARNAPLGGAVFELELPLISRSFD